MMKLTRWMIWLALASCSTPSPVTVVESGMLEGKPLRQYTLTNASGLVAKLTNYGATLTELQVPDRQGNLGDIVLGFDRPQGYLGAHPYFGVTAGRVANRIREGKFTLNGKDTCWRRTTGRTTSTAA